MQSEDHIRTSFHLQLSKSSDRSGEKIGEVQATPEAIRDATEVAPYSAFQKGGDPAAGSPTATLLRLRPSH